MSYKHPFFSLYEAENIDTYWYLGSPYTKYEGGIQLAFDHICLIANKLISIGISVYSPIVHCHPLSINGVDPLDFKFWLKNQEGMMKAAHGMIVATMAGWDTSFGVNFEMEFFAGQDKPIRMLTADIGLSDPLLEKLVLSADSPEKINETIDMAREAGFFDDVIGKKDI